MVDQLSEQYIKQNCPMCDVSSQTFLYPLEETTQFRVICDRNPLVEGHVLLIPKQHLACVGEYPAEVMSEFLKLYEKFYGFVSETYGPAASFEHGKIGQTVFHSHVHILPFSGGPLDIVPEGRDHLVSVSGIDALTDIYKQQGSYLFFSIADQKWLVDIALGAPRFFRDRFAQALSRPERGNWKLTQVDPKFMKIVRFENERCQANYKAYALE